MYRLTWISDNYKKLRVRGSLEAVKIVWQALEIANKDTLAPIAENFMLEDSWGKVCTELLA